VGVSSNLGDIGLTTAVASVVAVMGQIVTTPPAAFNGVEELSGDVTGSHSSVRLPSVSCWVRKAMRRFIHRLYRGRKNSINSRQAEKTKGVAMAAASMELRELLIRYVRAVSAAVQ
jgi:hypothetical protein